MKVDRMPPIKPKTKKPSAKAAAKSPAKSIASKTAPKKKAPTRSVSAKSVAVSKPAPATRVPIESAAPTIPTGMVIQNLRDTGDNRQEGRYVYGVISTREP